MSQCYSHQETWVLEGRLNPQISVTYGKRWDNRVHSSKKKRVTRCFIGLIIRLLVLDQFMFFILRLSSS